MRHILQFFLAAAFLLTSLSSLQAQNNCENDSTPPTLECRDSINVGILDSFIILQAEFLVETAVDDCTPAGDLLFSFSPDSTNTQRTFFPGGAIQQELEIWVTDSAGNQSSCRSIVLFQQPSNCVGDTIPPVIQCQEEIRVDVFFNGSVELWANDFVPSRIDNCSNPQQLTVSFAADTILQNRVFNIVEGDTYQVPVWVTDAAGNQSSCEVTVILFRNNRFVDLVVSSYIDVDGDCMRDAEEPLLPVENLTIEFFNPENPGGQPVGILEDRNIFLRPLADNTYQLAFDSTLFIAPGDTNQTISVAGTLVRIQQEDDLPQNCPPIFLSPEDLFRGNTVNLPVSLQQNCVALQTDIGTPFLRRCFENTYTISYCNFGTETAEGAYIEIEFDEFLEVNSSTLPWTSREGNVYRFDLGTVASAECGNFQVDATVSCEAALGQTHCVEAHIFPDDFCDPNSNWSGARIEVDGTCESDSVHFLIRNTGTDAMQQQSKYIVIEDVIMLQDGEFQLNAGESMNVKFPANGSTYRLEAGQVSDYPVASMPSVAVEGCGLNTNGTFSTGVVTQFSQNENESFLGVDCQQNIGAFDPNDKQGFPLGVKAEHFIEANTDLEYKIRFQNTGTDTAFNIIILDTLSNQLNPKTIQPGASSHDYAFSLLGENIVQFRFDNIMLPDSNVNEPASNGFVQFRIAQQPDLADGTIIENSAAIYFDFNEPIITNTTLHTIGKEFLEVISTVNRPTFADAKIDVFPNPFRETAIIRVHTNVNEQLDFQLFNAQGQLLRQLPMPNQQLELHRQDLPDGLYFFTIRTRTQVVGQGRISVVR